MKHIEFIDDRGSFTLERAENVSCLYFPVAGENGLKSALTPNFGGDCKLDRNSFLLEPVSAENLHNNRSVRNFWVDVEGRGLWSAVGASARQEAQRFTPGQEESRLTAGFLWQTVERTSEEFGLTAEVTVFIPPEKNIEVMAVTLRNRAEKPLRICATAAIPLYGRSADNLRDHRHVTSLLNRITATDHGVCLKPTLSFDERGHRKNDRIYYVCGIGGRGEAPVGFYPTVEAFIGEGGTLTHPRALLCGAPCVPPGSHIDGKEALGGIAFATRELQPGETVDYTVLLGTAQSPDEIDEALRMLRTREQVLSALEETKRYWLGQLNVNYRTADPQTDNYLKWVGFQPFLRRIYGCSFLPHHDYGRGGRGWRDLWQDCLSLLIMNPDGVRKMLLNHFEGVRIDGTNATIIGTQPGEFIADRNGIARVWMDHGVWPFMTVKLYIHQTGDLKLLLQKIPYFKDTLIARGTATDTEPQEGLRLMTAAGEIYRGTVLEHILLEHLCACCELGAHGHIRLRGADWNDALDMASERGESVAFTCAYAGNLDDIAELLLALRARGTETVELAEELETLLSSAPEAQRLAEFTARCAHTVSGKTVRLKTDVLAAALHAWAQKIREHVRQTQWLAGENEGWFNGYYDDCGRRVEGYFPGGVRMMLTGQVFAIMSGTATDEQTCLICRAADRYLYRREIGGYRLNTDFGELKLDLGRMFGFAYGEKENGAVFSHMTVMYANALYRRGFVREGFKALQTLLETSMDFETSRIYPGIPEYFNADGRGMYHYLTGAASWYMLTYVTEVFGVRGRYGALEIAPKLVREQFDANGEAEIALMFGGRSLTVTLRNPEHLDYGAYRVLGAHCGGKSLPIADGAVLLSTQELDDLADGHITVELGRKQAQ